MRQKTTKPLVTVYMPVFNASKYLSAAIESILSQSFTDFEFIIIDDASTDNSWSIIKKYSHKDSRIQAYKNKINLGVSLTSNIAISMAEGKLLARMDADDVSLPDRLQKQVDFLSKYKNIVAVGGQCIVIDTNHKIIGYKNFPIYPLKLSEMIFWAIPIQQPSMMVNLSLLPKNFHWYSRNKTSAEEVDLMFRFMKYGYLANLPDEILFYRHLTGSLSHVNPKQTYVLTVKSRLAALDMGFIPSFKAILINLAQLFVIALLPTKFINDLWAIVRGINKSDSDYKIGDLASINAK